VLIPAHARKNRTAKVQNALSSLAHQPAHSASVMAPSLSPGLSFALALYSFQLSPRLQVAGLPHGLPFGHLLRIVCGMALLYGSFCLLFKVFSTFFKAIIAAPTT
jgi:hypothetical protein